METSMENGNPQGACTVVTGAAGGIGRAVVRKLRTAGKAVVAVDVDAARLAAEYAGDAGVAAIACDLAGAEGFAALADGVKARFASVVGFVHAAGFDAVAPLGMIADDALARLVAVHADFPLKFLGWLGRRGNHAEGASCVLVSSLAAHEGAKGHAAYAAAKGAVEGLLKPAAAELAAKGVRLNAVVLGVVETEMSKRWLAKLSAEQLAKTRAEYPLGFGTPDAVADAIAFLLSEESRWITGQTLVCDGGHGVR